MRPHHLTAAVLIALALAGVTELQAAQSLPPGFTETRVTAGLTRPTAIAFAPDGQRIFITEQAGTLRQIRGGVLQAQPFLTIPNVDTRGEHGLVGIALDPDFQRNQYLYLHYVAKEPTTTRARIVRYTAGSTAVVPGSETPIFDLDPLGNSIFHVGGALDFGRDGKLYVAVGDNAGWPRMNNSQLLTSFYGKILRIGKDGSIPADNPMTQASGKYRAIWAYGLRNPFTMAIEPGSGKVFVNDVGKETWEEINEARPGGNYGWPSAEGRSTDARFLNPVFAYAHGPITSDSQGCGISGGTFQAGRYFFIDYCNAWLRSLNPQTGEVQIFAKGIAPNPVGLETAPDGSLYYLSYWSNALFRIAPTGLAPGQQENHSPVAEILMPAEGSTYVGGETIAFSAKTFDREDGTLPPSALTWQIDFHHDSHTHPFLPPTSGDEATGTFEIPTYGETSANVWYRIYLTVTDSAGLVTRVYRDIHPRVSRITVETDPIGLDFTLDFERKASPFSALAVAGMNRSLGVISPQWLNHQQLYEFSHWDHGAEAEHDFRVPESDSFYRAVFVPASTTRARTPASAAVPPPGATAYVAAADLDGNGTLDLAASSEFVDTLDILSGNGDGTFRRQTRLKTLEDPAGIGIGDFNRDGKADLALAQFRADTISVLSGFDGTGYRTTVHYPAGKNPSNIVVADLNRDGLEDLTVSNFGGKNVSTFLARANGTFEDAVHHPAGMNPSGVTVGDFNRDRNPDIAVANFGSDDVSVLLGDGRGGFYPDGTYAVGKVPFRIVAADANADGYLDLFVTNRESHTVSLLIGRGNGKFRAPVHYAVGTKPTSLVVGDFNRDSLLDVATSNFGSGDVSLLVGTGGGELSLAGHFRAGKNAFNLVTGDFNGDGWVDLAVANYGDQSLSVLMNGGASGVAFKSPALYPLGPPL